jgi:hypothetical protein
MKVPENNFNSIVNVSMKVKPRFFFAILPIIFTAIILNAQENNSLPHLQKLGASTQLIVDGKPFIILGGELGNSSFTSLVMDRLPKLKAMHLNTFWRFYWELIEPGKAIRLSIV